MRPLLTLCSQNSKRYKDDHDNDGTFNDDDNNDDCNDNDDCVAGDDDVGVCDNDDDEEEDTLFYNVEQKFYNSTIKYELLISFVPKSLVLLAKTNCAAEGMFQATLR